MTTPTLNRGAKTAFTLIELLVVMSIIALLAGMIIPAAGVAIRNSQLKRASAELKQLETVIERYKAQKGFYPPDNTNNNALPQLFYELTGTYLVPVNGTPTFTRINGLESIEQADVPNFFHVGGFMNSSPITSVTNQTEIQAAEARNFWPGLESGKYAFYRTNVAGKDVTIAVLGLPFEGPEDITATNNTAFNTWHYNSSNPTNNPDHYDLWLDMKVAAPVPFTNPKFKINRICNWSTEPVIVQ